MQLHMACRDVLLQVIFYRRRCFSFLSLRDYLGNRRTKIMCAREIPIRLRNPFVRTLLRYSSLGSSKYERKRICTAKVWVGPRSVTWGPKMMNFREIAKCKNFMFRWRLRALHLDFEANFVALARNVLHFARSPRGETRAKRNKLWLVQSIFNLTTISYDAQW